MFLVFVLEFDLWSENVHQHVIKNSDSITVSQVNSTICHFGWRTTIRQHLSRPLLYPLVGTLALAPVVYRSGHPRFDELYSSPYELLLVKWTSVFVLNITRPALGGGGEIRVYQNQMS